MGEVDKRILVCGSRNWRDKDAMWKWLDTYRITNPFFALIEGEAPGADTLAREWADARGVPVMKFPANWKKYGPAAGPIRNREMLKVGNPDVVIAFHEDIESSKGTKDMIRIAKAKNVPVILVGAHVEFGDMPQVVA